MNIYLKIAIYAFWAIFIIWTINRLFAFEIAAQLAFYSVKYQIKNFSVHAAFDMWVWYTKRSPSLSIRVIEKFKKKPFNKRTDEWVIFINNAEEYIIQHQLRHEL